jgi:hypothetical protein
MVKNITQCQTNFRMVVTKEVVDIFTTKIYPNRNKKLWPLDDLTRFDDVAEFLNLCGGKGKWNYYYNHDQDNPKEPDQLIAVDITLNSTFWHDDFLVHLIDIAPFVKEGSYITFQSDAFDLFRIVFKNKTVEIITPQIIWPE